MFSQKKYQGNEKNCNSMSDIVALVTTAGGVIPAAELCIIVGTRDCVGG